jgi:hypothetical protein
MIFARMMLAGALALATPAATFAADDILDAIDQARKSYQDGNFTAAKQSLDLASQLVGQKNAESFATLLPAALPGRKAEKARPPRSVSPCSAPPRRAAATARPKGTTSRCASPAIRRW